jgi:hypothetical protein
MDWMQLLNQVSQNIYNNQSTPHQPGEDPGNLIGNLSQIFMQQQAAQGQPSRDTLEQVKQEIYNNPSVPHQPGNDQGGLISGIEQLFAQAQVPGVGGNVQPAAQDKYGDAADDDVRQQYQRQFGAPVETANQDPYGDAADEGTGQQQFDMPVEQASQDPYGDAAAQDQGQVP